MKQHRIAQVLAILVAAASPSCDPNSPTRYMKEARRALAAKGMTVGAFKEVDNYPGATAGREQVQCATVSRAEGDGRVCLVTYDDIGVTIRAANLEFRAALPEGSRTIVSGKNIFVVEPGARPSTSLVQEIYNELEEVTSAKP